MIKKFKIFERNEDIDPYSEEDWGYEPKFKIGDIVTCVMAGASGEHLNYGQKYEIEYVRSFANDYIIKLKGVPSEWFGMRFVKDINESYNELDPYGEEDWNDKLITLGTHKIITNSIISLRLFDSREEGIEGDWYSDWSDVKYFRSETIFRVSIIETNEVYSIFRISIPHNYNILGGKYKEGYYYAKLDNKYFYVID